MLYTYSFHRLSILDVFDTIERSDGFKKVWNLIIYACFDLRFNFRLRSFLYLRHEEIVNTCKQCV